MILEIERTWGRPPGWFWRRSRSEQVRLLAWHRTRHLDAVEQSEAAQREASRPRPVAPQPRVVRGKHG